LAQVLVTLVGTLLEVTNSAITTIAIRAQPAVSLIVTELSPITITVVVAFIGDIICVTIYAKSTIVTEFITRTVHVLVTMGIVMMVLGEHPI